MAIGLIRLELLLPAKRAHSCDFNDKYDFFAQDFCISCGLLIEEHRSSMEMAVSVCF